VGGDIKARVSKDSKDSVARSKREFHEVIGFRTHKSGSLLMQILEHSNIRGRFSLSYIKNPQKKSRKTYQSTGQRIRL
jgi:hypothetical protein